MKNISAFIILTLVLVSCKKAEPSIPSTPSDYVYVSTAGSYWVYDCYNVNASGNESIMYSNDTIRLEGDSTINGKTYHWYVGTEMGSAPIQHFERDSSGYIVNQLGEILYSYVNNTTMLTATHFYGPYKEVSYVGPQEWVSTLLGTKMARKSYMEGSYLNGNPINVCGDSSVRFNSHFVSGIGLVQKEREQYMLHFIHCSKKRIKLKAYYIAP